MESQPDRTGGDRPPREPPAGASAASAGSSDGPVTVAVRDPAGPGLGMLIYRALALLFLLALLLLHFDAIARVFLLGFVAAIVAVGLNKVVGWLPMRRAIAAPVTALAFLALAAVPIYLIGDEVARQLNLFLRQLPQIWETVLDWQRRLHEETGLDISLVGERAVELIRELPGVLRQAIGLLEVVGLVLLVLIGAFYIVAEPNRRLMSSFMRVIPRTQRPAWYRVFHLLGDSLARWLWGSLISIFIIGTLSTIAFYILGTPYPLLLGVNIGVLEIIPLVGPWIGGITAVLITLAHDPGLALWVALAVFAIQQVEGNLIYPVVMRGAVSVHPFVTLLSLILFSAMFGLLGAILSLPLVLAIQTLVHVFWVEERLGAQDDPIEPVVRDDG